MKKFTSLVALAVLGVSSAFAAGVSTEGMSVIKDWTPDAPLVCTKAWSTEVAIPKSLFKDATAECVVVFHFSEYGTDADAPGQIQIATKDPEWTWMQLNDYDDITGTDFPYALNATTNIDDEPIDLIECVKFSGIILKGQNFTLSGATLMGPAGTVEPAKEYVTVAEWAPEAPAALSWSKEVSIPKSFFKNATTESVIRLHFDSPAEGDQVQYSVKMPPNYTWTELNDYDDVDESTLDIVVADIKGKTGSVTPAEAVEGMQFYGMFLKGKGTVTKAELLAPKGGDTPVGPVGDLTVVGTWTPGASDVTDPSNWGKEINIPASAFAEATLEATVRINFATSTAECQLQPVVKVGTDWTWTELEQQVDLPGEKCYEFTMSDFTKVIDAEVLLKTLKDRGMIIKGKGFTLGSVEVLLPADDVVEYVLVNEYTVANPEPVKAWSTEVHIDKAEFDKVTDKSKIELLFTDCAGGQFQPVVKVGEDFTWTQLADYVDLTGEVFTIKIDELAQFTDVLSAEEFIAGLKNDGFYMKGQKFTFTGMKLYNPKDAAGVTDIVAGDEIDFNAPVEIYNLQGIRVAEMTAGNLYIVRQGNVTKKIVK